MFSGDILRFPHWIKSFVNLIEENTNSPTQRLHFMDRYTSGNANDVMMDSQSNACFITDALVSKIQAKKRQTDLQLSTMLPNGPVSLGLRYTAV